MSQFPQDGENGQNVAFFLDFLFIFSTFLNCFVYTLPVLRKLTHMCDDLYLHIYWNLCCVYICVVFVFVFSFAEQSRVLGATSAAVRHLRVTRSLDCDLPPIPTNPSLNTRHHEPACPR